MKRNKNSNNIRKRRRQRNGSRNLLSIPRLPSNTSNIEVRKMIRYNEVTAGITNIDRKDLLNLIVLPLTTTTAAGLLKSVKIDRVQCWNVTSTATNPIGTGDDLTVTWLSSLGREITVRSTQMGVAPGYIDTSPPTNSLASFWTNISSDLSETVVEIDANNGSIIDITYSIIFANNQAARTFSITTGVVNVVSYNSFGSFTVQGYQNYTPA